MPTAEPANGADSLMASAVELTASRHANGVPSIPARLAIRADKWGISAGISAAHFGLSGFRLGRRRMNLLLPDNQMTVTAQHPCRVVAPRAVKRFEQMRKDALARRARTRLAYGGNSHRCCPACWWFRLGSMAAGAKRRCEIFHNGFVVPDK